MMKFYSPFEEGFSKENVCHNLPVIGSLSKTLNPIRAGKKQRKGERTMPPEVASK
jgi:hypothetical protein